MVADPYELEQRRTLPVGLTVSAGWDRDEAYVFVEELFAKHQNEIYAYLLRMLRDPDLAADPHARAAALLPRRDYRRAGRRDGRPSLACRAVTDSSLLYARAHEDARHREKSPARIRRWRVGRDSRPGVPRAWTSPRPCRPAPSERAPMRR